MNPDSRTELFETLWENSPDGLRLTDRAGRIHLVNESYCRMAGLGRQELVGSLLCCVYPEPERAYVMQQYREFLEDGSERPVVRREWQTPAGRTIWVEGLLKRVNVCGEIAVLGVFRDITLAERSHQRLRRALEAALRTRQRLQAVFSSTTVGLGLLDAEGRFEEANASLCRMLGMRREELLGTPWEKIWGCGTCSHGVADAGNPSSRGSPCICRSPTAGAAEKLFVERIPLSASADEQRTGAAVIVMDLTPLARLRQKSSLALAKTSLLLQEIANLTRSESSACQQWENKVQTLLRLVAEQHNADRTCLYQCDFEKGGCTPAAEWARPGMESPPDVLGQFPLDLMGQQVQQLLMGEWVEIEDVGQIVRPDLRELLQRLGIKSMLAVPVIGEARRIGWIALYAIRAPRRFGAEVGAEVRALAQMVAGIESLQRMKRHLEEAKERLAQSLVESEQLRSAAEQASRAKSEFLAMMSHEIRTPLNGVLGVLNLLERDPLPATTHEYLVLAKDSATSLLSLLNDLLDLARIEAGTIGIAEQEVDLLELLDQVLAAVAQAAAARGLTLVSLVDARLPTRLKADPARLRQVLLNLLGNAVKFTERGSIVLKAALTEQADGPAVCFHVRDTGPGIESTDIDRIFEAFYQSRPRRFAAGRGAGLGLALSRRLAELMGGRLGVRSEPGCGSEFTIMLPLRTAAGTDLAPCRLLGGRRIVVSHQDRLQGESISWQLSEWGAHVVGQNALSDGFDAALISGSLASEFARSVTDNLKRNRQWRPRIGLLVPLGGGPEMGQIARQLGAEIFVEPLRWSRVLDWLQREAAASAEPVRQRPPESDSGWGSGPAPYVLIADDNAVNRRITAALLEKLGCRVETACDGQEAVARIAQQQPDLTLLDLEMPGMGGLEVIRRVRAGEVEGVSRSLRLYALTAHVLPEERQKTLEAGADGFLCKPVSVEQLKQVLIECFSQPQPGAECL